MHPTNAPADFDLTRPASELENYQNGTSIREVERMHALLGQLLQAQAQGAVLEWQRGQPWAEALKHGQAGDPAQQIWGRLMQCGGTFRRGGID